MVIWSLMIGSFSRSCSNLCISAILTTREIRVEYRLVTFLPETFSVFSPFSFVVSLVFFFCLSYPLNILVFYAALDPLWVYQMHPQGARHCLIFFLQLTWSILHIEIATMSEITWQIRVVSMQTITPLWSFFNRQFWQDGIY